MHVNTVPNEIVPASREVLDEEIRRYGRSPEFGIERYRESEEGLLESAFGSYIDDHPTHFDWVEPVRALIVRVQKKFPWLTYANTYFRHPPIYGRLYEFLSFDLWAGGLVNGRYVGYRGKNIWEAVDGWEVFNSVFNDPYLPNIHWAIFNGYMWTSGYGWGPSPAGRADSDPRHDKHPHFTMFR